MPIPASPERTSAAGPVSASLRNAWMIPNSPSRPMICPAMRGCHYGPRRGKGCGPEATMATSGRWAWTRREDRRPAARGRTAHARRRQAHRHRDRAIGSSSQDCAPLAAHSRHKRPETRSRNQAKRAALRQRKALCLQVFRADHRRSSPAPHQLDKLGRHHRDPFEPLASREYERDEDGRRPVRCRAPGESRETCGPGRFGVFEGAEDLAFYSASLASSDVAVKTLIIDGTAGDLPSIRV